MCLGESQPISVSDNFGRIVAYKYETMYLLGANGIPFALFLIKLYGIFLYL